MKNWKGFALVVSFVFLILGCSKRESSPTINVTAYAAAYAGGIYQTDNGGVSWYPLNIDPEPLQYYFKRIYPDPQNEKVLYVTTTGNGLFRIDRTTGSLDQIETFKDQIVTAMTFWDSATEGPSLIVGTSDKGLFRAQDFNGPWQAFNEGLSYREINVLLTAGKDLYVGTVKDLQKWNEPGKHWESRANGIKNNNIISLAATPDGKTLFAGSGVFEGKKSWFADIPCLYRSADQGATWQASDKGLSSETLVYAIAVNPHHPERVYLGTSAGVYRSVNSGQKWKKTDKGLPKAIKALDLKIMRINETMEAIFIAAENKGVFMALDNENPSWVSRSYGLEPTAITSIILAP